MDHSTIDPPGVRLEACVAFTATADEPEVCEACGWLADDHPPPATEVAPAAA